jgi:hypothetical protein
MGMLFTVFAVSLLDPIRLIVVLAIETLLTASQYIRVWGQGLGFGLATSLVQALVVYGLFEVWRSRRVRRGNRPTGQSSP